ncbi:MAG: hypothetical protein VKL59_04005 [Nostocaceae cyanobacterium]|nr:hypothetical protein [Nostocaceae cyanobacterium]
MLKRLFPSLWLCRQPYVKFIVALLLIAPIVSAAPGSSVAESFAVEEHKPLTVAEDNPVKAIKQALEAEAAQKRAEAEKKESDSALSKETPIQTSPETEAQTEPVATDSHQDEPVAQADPVDSPHPIPWNWILKTQEEMSSNVGSGVRFYRTPSILSPDGMYAAYSRVQMDVSPEMHRSRVSSVMFVENLQTGKLQAVTASSPLANNPLLPKEETDIPGIISVLMPLGWSQQSERLLARQFEGLFNTSDATDYGLIWNRQDNTTSTIAPAFNKDQHDMSVLLGWSQTEPEQVLFRAGILGEERWPLFAVMSNGTTLAASKLDQPILFGKTMNQIWAGPQFAFR